MKQGPEDIEELISQIESLTDPVARESSIALVQALMEFHGASLERLMEIVAAAGDQGYALFNDFAADDVVANLLLLYGLHPLSIETRVMQALDSVRPYLDSHGGNVELLGITEGNVRLRMQGSCKSCPSSSMTLKLAIEEAIYRAAPDVVSIEPEGTSEQPTHAGLVHIGKPKTDGRDGTLSGGGAWSEVKGLASLPDNSTQLVEVMGRSVLFCRLGESLYAYGNNCPGCDQPLKGAYLQMTSLVCTACGGRYDLVRAGRGLDQPNLHLEPLPLLVEQGRTKVALPPLSTN